MRSLPLSLLSLLAATTVAVAAPEFIPGCQGEGCDCFHEYRSATQATGRSEQDIATIRPFTLYKERSDASQRLGEFNAGVKARPLTQELVVEDKGEYVVVEARGSKLALKKGDRIDTVIAEGEGFSRGRKGGKWIDFDYETIKLREVKKTRVTAWLSVKINGLTGFTPQQPFQMCLE